MNSSLGAAWPTSTPTVLYSDGSQIDSARFDDDLPRSVPCVMMAQSGSGVHGPDDPSPLDPASGVIHISIDPFPPASTALHYQTRIMYSIRRALGASLLIACVSSQTPPGSTPATNNQISVQYGSTPVTPGIMLEKTRLSNPSSSSSSFPNPHHDS